MKKILLTTLLFVLGLSLSPVARAVVAAPDDIRVAPMLRSKWGQSTHNGLANGVPCFNRKTPKNAYCGCVATSFAQIMRHLQYPTSLDWANMPLSTLAGVTDTEAETIGTFVYNLGVKAGADYASEMTYITVGRMRNALCNDYGFAQTEILAFDSSQFPYNAQLIERLVVSNCDHERPLIFSVDDEVNDLRHNIVVDGYGYSQDGTRLVVHIVAGAYGEYDGWYEAPNFPMDDYDFSSIGEVAYNILPQESGTIVSGRIINPDGSASVGATVTLTDASGVVQATQSRARGVYSFVVAKPGRCELFAKLGANTNSLVITCTTNVSPTVVVQGSTTSFRDLNRQQVGNTIGNDIHLLAPPPDAPDVPLPDVGQMPPPGVNPPGGVISSAATVRLTNAVEGAEIRYTLDGTEPTRTSPLYTGPFSVPVPSGVAAKTLVRARAWHDALTESDEGTAVFLSPDTTVAAPTLTVKKGNVTLSPSGGAYSFSGSVSVKLASTTPGATFRYTLDGTDPTVLSPEYSNDGVAVSDNVTFKARAWKDGQLASSVSSVNFVYDSSTLPAIGDEYDAPMLISGISGSRVSDKTYRYTLDASEKKGNTGSSSGLNHLYGKCSKMQFHTAYFRWKAPASGSVTFTANCPTTNPTIIGYGWSFWCVGAAVYRGAERSSQSRVLQSYDETVADNIFSFSAVAGETYLIVLVSMENLAMEDEWSYDDVTADYHLSWDMQNPVYPSEETTKIDISGAAASLSDYVVRYTGAARSPTLSRVICNGVVLRDGTDYRYDYENNINAGKGRVRITGINGYRGEMVATFDIVGQSITGPMVTQVANQPRTGGPVCPKVHVQSGGKTLQEGVDYELVYANNVRAGAATVTVVGKGNYRGEVSQTFWIYKDPDNPVMSVILISRNGETVPSDGI